MKSFRSDGDKIAARLIHGDDGRPILQMRVTMGVLQMELENRPDGQQPHGCPTLLDYHRGTIARSRDLKLTPKDWTDVDRELMQYYHRRVCLLAVGSLSQGQGRADRALDCFRRAGEDAEHYLGLLDLIREFCPDNEFVATHEMYRPFVLFHRTLARVQGCILQRDYERAIDITQDGIAEMLTADERDAAEAEAEAIADPSDSAPGGDDEEVVEAGEIPDDAEFVADGDLAGDEDEEEVSDIHTWVRQLHTLIEQIRDQHGIDRTLREQLDDAIKAEDYERAAAIRRAIDQRRPPSESNS